MTNLTKTMDELSIAVDQMRDSVERLREQFHPVHTPRYAKNIFDDMDLLEDKLGGLLAEIDDVDLEDDINANN